MNRQKRSAASVRCGAVTSSGMSAAIGVAPLGRIDQPELMIDRVVSDHDVRAVVGIAPDDCRRANPPAKPMGVAALGGRGRQDDDRRQFVGPPEDR